MKSCSERAIQVRLLHVQCVAFADCFFLSTPLACMVLIEFRQRFVVLTVVMRILKWYSILLGFEDIIYLAT